jgi:two-component system sensor histidine kinase KdpD
MKHLVSLAVLPSLIAFATADALAAGGPIGATNPAGRSVGLDRALIRMSPEGAARQMGTLNANPLTRPDGRASATSATSATPAIPAVPAIPADPSTRTPATPATPAVPPKPPGK